MQRMRLSQSIFWSTTPSIEPPSNLHRRHKAIFVIRTVGSTSKFHSRLMDRLSCLPLELRELVRTWLYIREDRTLTIHQIVSHVAEYYQVDNHLVQPSMTEGPSSCRDLCNLRLVSRTWAKLPLVMINNTLKLELSNNEDFELLPSRSVQRFFRLAMSPSTDQVFHLHIRLPLEHHAVPGHPSPQARYLRDVMHLCQSLHRFTRLETLTVTHSKKDFVYQAGVFFYSFTYQDCIREIFKSLRDAIPKFSRLRHLEIASPMVFNIDVLLSPPTVQPANSLMKLHHLNIRVSLTDRLTPLQFLAYCSSLKTLSITMEHDDPTSDLTIPLDGAPLSALTQLEGLCLRSVYMRATALFGILEANRRTLRKLELINMRLRSGSWAMVFTTIMRERYPLLRSLRTLPTYDPLNGLSQHSSNCEHNVEWMTKIDSVAWTAAVSSIYQEAMKDAPPSEYERIWPPMPDMYAAWWNGQEGCDSIGRTGHRN